MDRESSVRWLCQSAEAWINRVLSDGGELTPWFKELLRRCRSRFVKIRIRLADPRWIPLAFDEIESLAQDVFRAADGARLFFDDEPEQVQRLIGYCTGLVAALIQ